MQDKNINRIFFEASNDGKGLGHFYITYQNPEFKLDCISGDEFLTAEEHSVIKAVTSELLKHHNKTNAHEHSNKTAENSSALNEKTKSLLGELHKNQDKLSESNKTADLSKNMTKTPEVSL